MRPEQVEFAGLVSWIEKQLTNDLVIERDAKTLAEILACDPEDISRRQRGDTCYTTN
jgi:hypothetical protein